MENGGDGVANGTKTSSAGSENGAYLSEKFLRARQLLRGPRAQENTYHQIVSNLLRAEYFIDAPGVSVI